MDIMEAMRARHSVRHYLARPIEAEKAEKLYAAVKELNAESGLSFRLFLEEPQAFAAHKPHYGSFRGCRNYLALAGPKDAEEKIGYYGEKFVLYAQQLGLNTCWVALTYQKDKVDVAPQKGEKLHDVIALGYGEDAGVPHKSKPFEKLYRAKGEVPAWFRAGLAAAALAPTAINQQRFLLVLEENDRVRAKALLGPCSKTDLGIVKYHFELGAGKENFTWAE